MVEQAPDWKPPQVPTDEDEAAKAAVKAAADAKDQELIDRLARLPPIDYDHQRRDAARELGIRPDTLDREVGNRQRVQVMAETPVMPHWNVEPWPEPVDGGELITEIMKKLRTHAVISDAQALIMALPIIQT